MLILSEVPKVFVMLDTAAALGSAWPWGTWEHSSAPAFKLKLGDKGRLNSKSLAVSHLLLPAPAASAAAFSCSLCSDK